MGSLQNSSVFTFKTNLENFGKYPLPQGSNNEEKRYVSSPMTVHHKNPDFPKETLHEALDIYRKHDQANQANPQQSIDPNAVKTSKMPSLLVHEINHSQLTKQEILNERQEEDKKANLDQSKYRFMDPLLNLPELSIKESDIPKVELEHPIANFYQRRDYKYLISNDDLCSSENFPDKSRKINLLMAIKSSCNNKPRRDAIRKTWGNRKYIQDNVKNMDMKLLFLLGKCKTEGYDEIIHDENKETKDLIQWDFDDSFRNLTVKECLFLQFEHNKCDGITHIFKGDDDIFVNPFAISRLILEQPDQQDIFMGAVLRGSPRILDHWSKYYVPATIFPDKIYPPYVSGGGYIFSKNIADKLFLATLSNRIIPIDDAFVGMLLKTIGKIPSNNPGFKSWGAKEEERKKECFWHEKVVYFHKEMPEQLMKLWGQFIADNGKCKYD